MPALRFRSFLAGLAATSTFAGCTVGHQAGSPITVRVSQSSFGRLADGRAVDLYTLTNAHGVEIRVMTYGAIITVVRIPDRSGDIQDITLGFDSLAGQSKDEIVRKMQEFKAGTKPGTVMPQLAKGYTDAQIELAAGWFASRKPDQSPDAKGR